MFAAPQSGDDRHAEVITTYSLWDIAFTLEVFFCGINVVVQCQKDSFDFGIGKGVATIDFFAPVYFGEFFEVKAIDVRVILFVKPLHHGVDGALLIGDGGGADLKLLLTFGSFQKVVFAIGSFELFEFDVTADELKPMAKVGFDGGVTTSHNAVGLADFFVSLL